MKNKVLDKHNIQTQQNKTVGSVS